jgi:DNA-binding transcriptional regulator GbsR (MarR family)
MPGWRQRFIEELGGLALEPGTPRPGVRVLGWLVVSVPPQQSAQQIQAELTLSAGSVSAAVRMLADDGMIERVAHPGDRHTYYRLRRGGWERAMAAHFRTLVQVREIADRALEARGAEADHRLGEMKDTYAWFGARIAELLVDTNDIVASGERSLQTQRNMVS